MDLIHRLGYNPEVMRLWGRYGYPVLTRWVRRDKVLYPGPRLRGDSPMALPLARPTNRTASPSSFITAWPPRPI